jgi:hypothetical protein
VLDPLELIHALTTQIPDARSHLVRYLGAYSNRAHHAPRPPARRSDPEEAPTKACDEADSEPWRQARRASWARLLRRIFEVDPLLCRCGGALRVRAIITELDVVDRILSHIRDPDTNAFDPFEPKSSRAPPGARCTA